MSVTNNYNGENKLMEQLTGVVGILLGIWKRYAVYKAFKDTKQQGNKSTSTFLPLALWSGVVLALAFIGIGIALVMKIY